MSREWEGAVKCSLLDMTGPFAHKFTEVVVTYTRPEKDPSSQYSIVEKGRGASGLSFSSEAIGSWWLSGSGKPFPSWMRLLVGCPCFSECSCNCVHVRNTKWPQKIIQK